MNNRNSQQPRSPQGENHTSPPSSSKTPMERGLPTKLILIRYLGFSSAICSETKKKIKNRDCCMYNRATQKLYSMQSNTAITYIDSMLNKLEVK